MPMQTYYVQEFAKLAGVTVRTLHFYDQAGLLTPAKRNGVRRYEQGDLLRLQQILTLKSMGFSLGEIRALLESPGYDVGQSLRIQKEAIDQRIAQLQEVSRALAQTIELVGTAQDLDWAHVAAIIRIVSGPDKGAWHRRYFSEEQLAQLAARQTPPEEVRAGERAWMELIAAFDKHRHLPPGHPDVQRLAAQMVALVQQFTQGDPGLRASLEKMYRNFDDIPEEYRMYDADLQRFMGRAFAIYEERDRS
jgi:MerR family transcriptional regulator, thiopeptide resistance regulator